MLESSLVRRRMLIILLKTTSMQISSVADNMLKVLSDRQEYILNLVVRRYVETGVPLGSQTLVDHYTLEVSAATVRNELALLDQLGYLTQLHTSAGRIPTEMGYRTTIARTTNDQPSIPPGQTGIGSVDAFGCGRISAYLTGSQYCNSAPS